MSFQAMNAVTQPEAARCQTHTEYMPVILLMLVAWQENAGQGYTYAGLALV